MSANFSTNLVAALNERADDLAQTKDPADVKKVIEEAQVIARAQTEPPAYYGDRCVYRITVAVLGLAVILVVIAQFLLAWNATANAEIPDGIISIGSAAIGALAGLLAPTAPPGNGTPPAK